MQGKNKDQRTAQWKLMKESVSKRCQAEIARAAEKTKKIFGKARLNRVQTLLQDTPAAVLACHTGNCGDLCKSSSLVCSGKKNGKQYNDHIGPKLKKNKNKKQIEILKNMIHVRLVEKLPDTYKNVGTNFIEGVNRAIISTNPKTNTFTRQWKARHSRAILNVNEGSGAATIMIANKLDDPLTMNIQVNLLADDKVNLRKKEIMKKPKAKKRAEGFNQTLRIRYEEKRAKSKLSKNDVGYKKETDLQLDNY